MDQNFQEEKLLTKIRFLQQEVSELTEENQELKQLLSLNKQMISTLSQPLESWTKSQFQNMPDPTKQSNEQQQSLKSLFQNLFEENAELLRKNQQLGQQRDALRSQCLIHEQIAERCQQKELELEFELYQKTQEFRDKIEEKSRLISEYEEQSESRNVTKKIHSTKCYIYETTKQTLPLHQEINTLSEKLYQVLNENELLREAKKQLQIHIEVLTAKTNKLKTLKIPPKFYGFDSDQSLKSSDSGKSNESEVLEDLPIKIKTQASLPQKNKPNFKLDIQKAQKYQNLSVQKQEQIEYQEELNAKQFEIDNQQMKNQQNQMQNQPNYPNCPAKILLHLNNLTEQLRVTQKELQSCKLKLQDEMLFTKMLQDQITEQKLQIENYEQTNKILIKSQENYEQKWQSIHQQFDTYYNYFISHQNPDDNQQFQYHPYFLAPKDLKVEQKAQIKSLLEMCLPQNPSNSEQLYFSQVKTQRRQQLKEMATYLTNMQIQDKINRAKFSDILKTRTKSEQNIELDKNQTVQITSKSMNLSDENNNQLYLQ